MSLCSTRSRGQPHHLRHRTDAELNLIPLIDILSVMVAFLLVYSVDVEVIQNTRGVEVPQSTAEEQPRQSVVVMITKDQLFVQGELVASVAEIRAARTPYVEALREVFARPMGDTPQLDPAEPREITLISDKAVPYEVVKKVMATCTAATYGRISLAVLEKNKPKAAASAQPA